METILFPDVQGMVIPFLRDGLEARGWVVTVASAVPNPRPATLVKVTRTGGTRDGLVVDGPHVTFQCWAATAPEAHRLARTANAILHASQASLVGGEWVYRVDDVGGVTEFPDPDTDYSRYQFTVRLHTRGKPI